ncbi:MAG: hypothetical protein O2894_08090 [Planctomycetota bacterium]|nr:hypothetical protein [Planctomycetota bacterium]
MSRPPARAARLDRVARCGAVLVIALVAVLPLALAFVPADALANGDVVGAGTGDELAAALSSLDRGLHGRRLVPVTAEQPACLAAAPFAALAPLPRSLDTVGGPPGDVPARPGNALPGPSDLGHPLRR